MNFIKKAGDCFMIGVTAQNNTISFVPVAEERLTIYDPQKDQSIVSVDTYIGRNKIEEVKPTVITLYCNFEVTTPMIQELERSKIVQVQGTRNERMQVELYPLFGFDFKKLKEVIYDLSVKFNL